MNFASLEFWVFMGVVYVLYRLLPHRGQNRMLSVASYISYGWCDRRFLSLIWITTVFDFYAVFFMRTRFPFPFEFLLICLAAMFLATLLKDKERSHWRLRGLSS